jgi:hypothetical protein
MWASPVRPWVPDGLLQGRAGGGGELLDRRGRGRRHQHGLGDEQGQVLDDVEEVDFGAELLREGHRVRQGVRGGLAEVGGHEDAAQVDHG